MKMGYFHNIHDVTRERDYEEMVNELREIAIYCDTAGFDAFWLTNIEQVAFKCSWPGFPHEHTMRSIRLLAEEVIPKVKARIEATAASAAE